MVRLRERIGDGDEGFARERQRQHGSGAPVRYDQRCFCNVVIDTWREAEVRAGCRRESAVSDLANDVVLDFSRDDEAVDFLQQGIEGKRRADGNENHKTLPRYAMPRCSSAASGHCT